MRLPQRVAPLALVLTLVQTTGCYTYSALSGPLPSAPSAENHNRRYKILFTDGREVTVQGLWQNDSAVGGYGVEAQNRVEFPRREVAEVSEIHVDGSKTVFVVPTGVLGVAGVYALVALSSG